MELFAVGDVMERLFAVACQKDLLSVCNVMGKGNETVCNRKGHRSAVCIHTSNGDAVCSHVNNQNQCILLARTETGKRRCSSSATHRLHWN